MEQAGNGKEGALDAIYGNNTVTLSTGEKVVVSRIKVRYAKRSLDLVRNIVSGLIEHGVSFDKNDLVVSEGGELLGINPNAILQLISNAYDEAFELLSFHVEMPHEALLDLDLEDGLALVAMAVRVNADFFIQRVVPLVMEVAASMEKRVVKKT